ncbi:MAG: MBL fold metallo-hydrolase [Gemmatimonadota bacterium]
MTLTVTFWGTRGSIPTPGPGTLRYGGNTPCVSVTSSAGRQLVLDAGTGIRALGSALERQGGAVSVEILLSHTHWDHIQGLPFFAPLFDPMASVRIAGPAQAEGSLSRVLAAQMDSSVFPVQLTALRAKLAVTEITPGPVEVSGFEVTSVLLSHPAPTLGYRIGETAASPAVAYITDNELADRAGGSGRKPLVRFLQDVSFLIHDAMYFDAQLSKRQGWGHSSAEEAVMLASEAGCRTLALFHHDPEHDDAAVDRLLDEARACAARLGASLEIIAAAETTPVSVGGD